MRKASVYNNLSNRRMRGKELIFFQKTFMDIKNDFLYLNKKRFSIIEIFTMNLSSTTENSRMSLLNIIICDREFSLSSEYPIKKKRNLVN